MILVGNFKFYPYSLCIKCHHLFCLPPLQAFGQFDAEGDEVVDVESMLIALKNSNGANLKGELSHVIRQLQACSLTPGMRWDLFNTIVILTWNLLFE